MSLFSPSYSIRKQVMSVIDRKIEKAQESLDQELVVLDSELEQTIKKAEENTLILKSEALEKFVNQVFKI